MSLPSVGDEKWLGRMLILLPGFFSVALARYLSNGPEIDEFSLVCYSLALSLFNFVLALLIYRLVTALVRGLKEVRNGKQDVIQQPELSLSFMATVLTLAIALGLWVGYIYSTDAVLAGLRHGPWAKVLTKRSESRPLSFLLAANRQGKLEEGRPSPMKQGQVWINIHLEGGKIFAGYPEFFPIGSEGGEVFLSPACSVDASGKARQWPGPGVLIPEAKISHITFIDREKSECHNIWRAIAKRFAAANSAALAGR